PPESGRTNDYLPSSPCADWRSTCSEVSRTGRYCEQRILPTKAEQAVARAARLKFDCLQRERFSTSAYSTRLAKAPTCRSHAGRDIRVAAAWRRNQGAVHSPCYL